MTYIDHSDIDLIEELEERGYTVRLENDDYNGVDMDTHDNIEKLYLDYMLTGHDFFDKQLRLFFQKYLNQYIR